MSLFRSKKSKSTAKLRPSLPADSSSSLSPPSSSSPFRRSSSAQPAPHASVSSYDLPAVHVDDFGRPIEPLPAFSAPHNSGGIPFGSGYGVGDDYDSPAQEMQLLYGYAPLATTMELSVNQVEEIVARCADEIRRRGLDTPLIMSSMALDISLEGVCSLIRTYLDDPAAWARDLQFATPLSIGAFLKWGLGRLVSERGTRGFVSWDLYSDFKVAERATSYQPKSCTVHLISRLAAANGRLLSTLLSFFSSVAAHSAKNGMPPRKLAALFSPYIFGLPDDRTFDETYGDWQRATDAFEHILLSYIRDQQASGPLPTFLEKFVAGYPATLNIAYTLDARPQIPKGARVEEVTRVKRLTRFHSRNLIQQSASWEVPHSNDWKLFFDPSNPSSSPVYTASYRHLLNIRSNHGLEDGQGADEDGDGEMQRHRTVVEKEWSKFGEIGFSAIDSKKLDFDLTESERRQPPKRDTIDWSTFETTGFSGREIFAPTDLVFHHSIVYSAQTWPSSQKALADKLRAAEQALPPFPYDPTPREEGRVLIERDFFEAWADVLVGGGWARDEMKESSFALIQWKARPRDGMRSPGKEGDSRTEERWVLVEEFVPREYREALLADPKVKNKQSKRVSFMRAVRRKSSQKPPPPSTPQPPRPTASGQPSFSSLVPAPLNSSYGRKDSSASALRPIDENAFDPQAPWQTQHLTLSNLHVADPGRSSYAASTAYAPSIVSTVRAADGHGSYSTADLPATAHDPYPPPLPPMPPAVPVSSNGGVGPGMTLSSQSRESAFGGQGVPVAPGYSKPTANGEKKGFLARMATKRNVKNGGSSPVATTAPEAIAAMQAHPARPVQQQPVVSSVPLSPGREQAGSGFAVPPRETSRNGVIPGAPPLAPVVESPTPSNEPTPPLPPKENFPASRTGTPLTHASRSTNGTSASLASGAEDDPYGGLDDSEVDDTGAEVGQVLFRGSQSYNRELNAQAGGPKRVPNPATLAVPTSPRQPRSHSLQDSPKPDAEVPIDEMDPRFAHAHQDRYLSGASQFSSRVANIVGLYENRGEGQKYAYQPRTPTTPTTTDIRLTQYGFGEDAAPAPAPPLP
ncbi:hypothetical protein JCM8097_000174 [Rhodosporidiobolus ruineniae]